MRNITLTANTGAHGVRHFKLFSPQTGFWTLAGGIMRPIFRGGTLQQGSRRAPHYDQAGRNIAAP